MKLFARSKNGKKRWREKALLINPHKTRLVFVAGRKQTTLPRSPQGIYKKLENLARNVNVPDSELLREISMPKRAFASRIRQENNLERL
jgi:hypothetical protein